MDNPNSGVILNLQKVYRLRTEIVAQNSGNKSFLTLILILTLFTVSGSCDYTSIPSLTDKTELVTESCSISEHSIEYFTFQENSNSNQYDGPFTGEHKFVLIQYGCTVHITIEKNSGVKTGKPRFFLKSKIITNTGKEIPHLFIG